MGLNKSKGQMYPWISHTWNPIRGRFKESSSFGAVVGEGWGSFDCTKKIYRG